MQKKITIIVSMVGMLAITGCATTSGYSGSTTNVDNSRGKATIYNDVSTVGPIAGIGIETQDIVTMSDKMMRDMITNPVLVGRTPAARIIIDEQYFVNESSSRINKKIITDRLRVTLNRAAKGRMVFVGRQYAGMVEAERTLKRDGMTDGGTIRTTQATAGADYRLGGSITSSDQVDPVTGTTTRAHNIVFEMIDLELGTIVWSDIYEFKKTAQDDILYR